MLALQDYCEFVSQLPKLRGLTRTDLESLWGSVRAFYMMYFADVRDVGQMLGAAEAASARVDVVRAEVSATQSDAAVRTYLDDVLDDLESGMAKALKRASSGVASAEVEQVAAQRALDSVNVFLPLVADGGVFCLSGELDEILRGYQVSMPAGWSAGAQRRTGPLSARMPRRFEIDKKHAQSIYGLSTGVGLSIVQASRAGRFDGRCAYAEGSSDPTVEITLHLLPERLLTESAHMRVRAMMSLILHECVHLMQYMRTLKSARGEMYTGVPPRKGFRYAQSDVAGQMRMRREFADAGLDPELVDFHTLDDVEFYAKLLQEALLFLDQARGESAYYSEAEQRFTDAEGAVAQFTAGSRFFEILREMQPDKYRTAVGELLQVATDQSRRLQNMYPCMFGDISQIKTMRRR